MKQIPKAITWVSSCVLCGIQTFWKSTTDTDTEPHSIKARRQFKQFKVWIDRLAPIQNITWQTERHATNIIALNNTSSPNLPSGPVLQLRQQWAEDKNATLAWLKGPDREQWWDRRAADTSASLLRLLCEAGLDGNVGGAGGMARMSASCFRCKKEVIWPEEMIRFMTRRK